jgi:hypothetical protein
MIISFIFLLGNVYIADTFNNRVRKVTISTGLISSVAGIGGTTGSFSGDNGPATSANLNFPYDIALDSSGILLFFYLYVLC